MTGDLNFPAPVNLPFSLTYNSLDSNQVVVAFDYTLNAFQPLSPTISTQVGESA